MPRLRDGLTEEQWDDWMRDSLNASRKAQATRDRWRVEQARLYQGMNLIQPGAVAFTDERETMGQSVKPAEEFSTGRYVFERCVAVLGVAVGMGLYRWWTGH